MEGSSRTATAADVGRGAPCSALPKDYRVILPPLPTGEGQRRAVVLHCDVTGRPYRIDDFRKPLKDAGIIQQVGGIGAYQMSHVWLLNLKTDEAKQALLDAGPLLVKNRPCLIIDPARQELRIKLHWVAFDVTSETIRRAFREYGEVKEVISDRWKAEDFAGAESTTRLVRLFLREGVTPDRVPHQMRLGSGTALVVVPGRAPLCLRCHNTGHIRRECRVPRCAACRAFGHEQANCTRSYARVASAGGDVDRSEMLMDEEEAESVAAVAASTSHAATAVASTRDAVSQENTAADAQAGDATQAGASTVQHEEEEVSPERTSETDFSKQQPPTSVSGTDGKTDTLRTAASEAVAPLGDNDSTGEAAMDAEATPAKRRLNEAGKTSQDTRLRAMERRENVPGTKKPRVASEQRSASLTRGGGGKSTL
ncbi:uncharacterized protein LOC125944302 [Dermacentor silvarum]|uniref:uncharacterized protein LOC125944302 n=1 Tax=Dermacentor silvarum TaxID=543639 RepID=UPI002101649A|nr:uncharacterized protein LOC125944302 [Dermacentor silvarum]